MSITGKIAGTLHRLADKLADDAPAPLVIEDWANYPPETEAVPCVDPDPITGTEDLVSLSVEERDIVEHHPQMLEQLRRPCPKTFRPSHLCMCSYCKSLVSGVRVRLFRILETASYHNGPVDKWGGAAPLNSVSALTRHEGRNWEAPPLASVDSRERLETRR